MFSTLRNRFGIPGVISVFALVFAMLGGAWAANDNGGSKATASAKAKKGPRGPKGATGPAGPAGPQGPAGANGKDGANGANGSNGTDGASVTGTPESPGANCPTGGMKLSSAGGEDYVCNGLPGTNGADGDPWTAGGILPVGSTETGTWYANVQAEEETNEIAAISFNVPLAAALDAQHVHYGTDINFADFDEGGPGTEGCTGTPETPIAPSGHLCVYQEANALMTFQRIGDLSTKSGGLPKAGAGSTGAGVYFLTVLPSRGGAYGTWAVTG